MEFVKHFLSGSRGGFRGEKTVGSAIFADGKLVIRLPSTKSVVESGITESGFGVVTETVSTHKSPYTLFTRKYDKDDLPPELRGQTYRYRIVAVQISENEFVFPFNKAEMLNKK